MSKITFRADDELIERLEEFDASKSEVMRRALRAYLDEAEPGTRRTTPPTSGGEEASLDDLVAERIDALIADRTDRLFTPRQPQDINVNIRLAGDSVDIDEGSAEASHADGDERKTGAETEANASDAERNTCNQCGETLSPSHVYCPNCGEKSARRVFCECGDELRSDWSFCPGCGRRTPAADVLDNP